MTTAERIRSLAGPLTRGDLLFAVLAGLTGVAGSFAIAGYSRQFLVAPIDALVVDLTPGGIIAFMIQNVGEEAHLLHISLSLLIATGLLSGAAAVGLLAKRRWTPSSTGSVLGFLFGGLLAGLFAWGITAAITGRPGLAIGAGGPVAVFTAVAGRSSAWPTHPSVSSSYPSGSSGRPTESADQSQGSGGHNASRRSALLAGASALAFVGVSGGLGWLVGRSDDGGEDSSPVDDETAALLDEAEEKSLDISGTVPGLVSPAGEFYNTDIAQFDPELSAADWELTITGEVGGEETITFDELTDMPTERRFTTLRCVGEALNGHKLDTAVWTGTPLRPLLEEVDPEGECGCAMLRAEDGYYVQFPTEALENGFLAWEMNGRPLPTSHGHPVRVLIPGHWGETNVKWLEEIELLDEEVDGYWEERGWHGTGPVETVAKLWSDTVLGNGNVELAGHAYAGTRGIDHVEVSIDGGDTWQDAELSEQLPGEDVWRQWRFEFEPDGTHEVVVRAIDGEGTVQAETESDSFPSGATGWVSKRIRA
ncbi:MAG: molybdopterin-dependent oxidoreductase [Haloarculaceae archaeon]